jgi:HD-GYP domain-containing protein (c-di-GMP phosphodiesterase class II)
MPIMKVLKLHYPVHTLDQELLLPAGAEVTREVLEELIASRENAPMPEMSILDFCTVRKDLQAALRIGPYRVIFNGRQRIEELLGYMEQARLAAPLLDYLQYFKKADPYTYLHILRVFALSTLLAHTLLDSEQATVRKIIASPVHDFGKICVPMKILIKSDPLTRTERGALEHHALAGYVLLSYYMGDPDSLPARGALEHHERRDGSGYPSGSPLTDPIVEIIAVSDVYDALISPRPYRKNAFENRAALEEIADMAETGALGWDVVKALVACNRHDKPHYSDCVVSREKRGAPPPGNSYGIIADEES